MLQLLNGVLQILYVSNSKRNIMLDIVRNLHVLVTFFSLENYHWVGRKDFTAPEKSSEILSILYRACKSHIYVDIRVKHLLFGAMLHEGSSRIQGVRYNDKQLL